VSRVAAFEPRSEHPAVGAARRWVTVTRPARPPSANPGATTRLTAGTVTVGAAGSPVLALQPISKTVVPGATFTLAANATGTGLAYQWFRNNVALSGETGAILLRNNRSEEHTSELQSHHDLVCRLLLEKKKKIKKKKNL